jgi:putative membrane protein
VTAWQYARRQLTADAGRFEEFAAKVDVHRSNVMNIRTLVRAAVLAGLGTSSAWAVSLAATDPAEPMPEDGMSAAAPLAIESWSAGSATLVPLMAADLQASQVINLDAPADTKGGAVGKPIEDVAFVKQATESGRKEVAAAREALPRLKSPQLKRIAEMLVSDHGNANARLSKIAEAKGWPVPAPTAAVPPAPGTAGSDFDAQWTADMIAGHERSVALYRAQARGGEDQDLRKYASDTLPTIEHHLAELRSLQK